MALTAKRQRFADVYNGNGVEACRLAGFKGTDAALATEASRLLKNAEVAAAIKARREREASPLIATRQARQAFWSAVMAGEPVAEFVTESGAAVKVAAEMKDRLKASELLGRSEADFTDKLAGADGGPLRVSFTINRTVKK